MAIRAGVVGEARQVDAKLEGSVVLLTAAQPHAVGETRVNTQCPPF